MNPPIAKGGAGVDAFVVKRSLQIIWSASERLRTVRSPAQD